MDAAAKSSIDVTLDRVTATLDRVAVLAEENEKMLNRLGARLDRMVEESARERAEAAKERAEAAKEAAKERAEAAKEAAKEREEAARERKKADEERQKADEERQKADDERAKAAEKSMEELRKLAKGVIRDVNGIGDSNGMVSEDYFFESLSESKMFGGVHFDRVVRNVTSYIKLEDGEEVNDEYDTVMYNDTSICIVEVKYKVERQDVRKLAKLSVRNFRKMFPMYAGYKIYLAVGGLTFEKRAVDAAKDLGVGVLRLRGDALEVIDENLKVY